MTQLESQQQLDLEAPKSDRPNNPSQPQQPKQHIQHLCHLMINGVFDRHTQTLYTAHGTFPTRFLKRNKISWKAFNQPESLDGPKRWTVYPKTTPDGSIACLQLVNCKAVDSTKEEVMRLTGQLRSIVLEEGHESASFAVYRTPTQVKEDDRKFLWFSVSGLLPVGEVSLKPFQVWELSLAIEDGKLVGRSAVLLKDDKERTEDKTEGKAKGKPKKKSVEIEGKQAA